MRLRKQDVNGDYTFGQGLENFYINVSEGVAQLIDTRLKLWTGEWFLDLNSGTPWSSQVLAEGTASTYNLAIKQRLVDTEGVISLNSYQNTFDSQTRKASVQATVNTRYSINALQITALL